MTVKEAFVAESIYATALRLATPAYLARLKWRGQTEPLYRTDWRERLGFNLGPSPKPNSVWIHAVSLGETRAAETLVNSLRQLNPTVSFLFTHGTATGRAAGEALMRSGDSQVWLPYDTPGAVRRFLKWARPSVGVLMETEVWPMLLREAEALNVPMILANARLSAKSERQGERFSSLMRAAAARLDLALAQTESDAVRLRRMGVPQVKVMGNLKFDMRPPATLMERGRRWRDASPLPVVMFASSRDGEEASLLELWESTGMLATHTRLWLVPRHPQRFDDVAALVLAHGWTLSRRSGWVDNMPSGQDVEAQVWLGDTLGEMPAYYAAADVGLLGGSFEPLGGQNLIEAAACGCPMVMGPSTFNFAEAAMASVEAGAAVQCSGLSQALAEVCALLDDESRREKMSLAASSFIEAAQGSAQLQAQAILNQRLPSIG